MKRIVYTLVILLVFGLGITADHYYSSYKKSGQVEIIPPKVKPLEKYSLKNLSQTPIPKEIIKIEKQLSQTKDFTSYSFSLSFDPTLEGKNKKKVSGVLNIPSKGNKFPLILMLRGYVDQQIYQSGMGTKKAAEVFAKNGFLTIAPDFLGYGESDKEAANIFESRFQTYTATLTILFSLDSLEKWNKKDVLLWAHSNGGQIALTVLEITAKNYPTILWAPVSKPFPYSILYYTDESADLGKLIRQELSRFEEDYDVNLFSLHQYLEKIKAPLQIQQGTGDEAIPLDWTNSLAKTLKILNPNLKYYVYPGADHNLQPAWNTVVKRDLLFFKTNLQ